MIGTNKRDAQETVEHVLDDLAEGRLADPPRRPRSVLALVRERQPDVVAYAGLGGDRRGGEGGRRTAGPPAREVDLDQRDARPAARCTVQGVERALGAMAEMQVKMGVSDSV